MRVPKRRFDETTMREGHRRRLRERFLSSGLEAFQDYEVLELLLTYAIPRKDVKALLVHFSSLSAVLDAPREDLQAVHGVGEQAAALITLIPQLFERYAQDKQRERKTISHAREAWEFIRPRIDKTFESMWMIAMNAQNRVLACEMIQKGSVNRTTVIPRLVAEAALKHRATGVILAHNHPGGTPYPSHADHHITSLLKKTLEALDITFLDHLIVTSSSYFSFAEEGVIS